MPRRDVPVTVRAVARAEPGRIFDVIVPIGLERIFHGFGPVPAVLGVRDQIGLWDHAGASRTVLLADGSEAYETLAWHDRPRGFGYRLEPGPGSSLARLVESARGTWAFAPADDGGTAIAWTYAFRPRRGRGSVVRAVLAPVWRQAARRALALAVQEAERRNARTASTRRWSSSLAGRSSLAKMFETCFSTAPGVTTSSRAIAAFVRPSAISASTSRSRGVSALERGVAAALGAAADQLGDDLAVERRAAGGDALERVEEGAHVADPLLEQVADAALACRPAARRCRPARRTGRGSGRRGRDAARGPRSPRGCPRR